MCREVKAGWKRYQYFFGRAYLVQSYSFVGISIEFAIMISVGHECLISDNCYEYSLFVYFFPPCHVF
jgi:hypothetical protein